MKSTTQRPTFADVFREALDRRGVSLTWVRDRLVAAGTPISLGALSYWRSGSREPARRVSLDALAEVERVLDLQPGALSSSLAQRRGPDGPSPFDELIGAATADGRARGVVVGEDVVDRLSFDLVVDVDAEGLVTAVRITQMFAAVIDGVASVTMFVGPDTGPWVGPEETNSTVLEAVAGCTIGEHEDLVGGIRAARLLFDRPLVAGESVMTEVRLRPTTREAAEDTEWGLVAEQRLEDCMVWVRFHPDRRPSRGWVTFNEAGLEHEWEVPVAGATGLHHHQTSFGPGVCGVRWEW